uniref:Profilin n=1 Tax=Ditylenchus dipsaci TaxID=166011 RepID=A0A915D2E2_9BILA
MWDSSLGVDDPKHQRILGMAGRGRGSVCLHKYNPALSDCRATTFASALQPIQSNIIGMKGAGDWLAITKEGSKWVEKQFSAILAGTNLNGAAVFVKCTLLSA